MLFQIVFRLNILYEEQLAKQHSLRISVLLAMRKLLLLLDMLDNKYLFDPSNYIQFQNPKIASRRKTTIPLKVSGISYLQEFYFHENRKLFQLALQAWHHRLERSNK